MAGSLDDLSGLTERLGDQTAFEVLKSYQSFVRTAVRAHAGYEVEFQGDRFLVAFGAANRAVRAAMAIARALATWSTENVELATSAKIGIHVGEPIKEGARFFGKPVIVASWIATAARGGEIVVSSIVTDLLAGNPELSFDDGREIEVKGLAGTQRVHRVLLPGMRTIPEQAPVTTTPNRTSSAGPNCFRLDGDFWTIAFEGRTVRVRDVKGLRYIAALLRRPAEDVHVADLASPCATEAVIADKADGEIARGLGDAGEVIDRQARAAYRSRLESLEEEIDEARSWNDFARVEGLEKEREFIAHELSSAYGLGGRARRASDVAERARKAVTSRIRDSIARIGEEHPDLARHLTTALRLGTFCRYEPEVAVAWAA